jgi:aryl-alcohol dehydrogenase-like predicted oxidoreductase
MAEADWISGRATPQGTRRFAARFPNLPGHFRCPDRLSVSSFGLGTRAGEVGGASDLLYRQAVPELLAGGVNLFDTALSDRMQTSERALGVALARAIREGAAARDELVVVSKGGLLTPDPELARSSGEARRNLIATYLDTGLVTQESLAGGALCLEPAFLRDQIERSRRNLRLATLDVWLIEQPELALQAFGAQEFKRVICRAFEALERAVSEGQIAAYGACTWDGLLRSHADRAHLSLLDLFQWALDVGGGDHHLRAIQLPYNLATTSALRLPTQIGPAGGTAAVLSALSGTGTLVLASAPLMQGRARGRLPSFVRECLGARLVDAQLCLQFARSSPGVTAAVVGMREAAHVEENLALARLPVAPPEAIEALFQRAAARGGEAA